MGCFSSCSSLLFSSIAFSSLFFFNGVLFFNGVFQFEHPSGRASPTKTPPKSPKSPHLKQVSSIASGTIASIEAALGNRQTAVNYMQLWKTVRQVSTTAEYYVLTTFLTTFLTTILFFYFSWQLFFLAIPGRFLTTPDDS
jgi:hypothetical protein